ncbi:MAG: rhomboid family intramembrane serine protease [Vicinamibacterales bacterium]
MFKRQTTGSVVCVSCGYLVGVNDDRCYHCGRRNPGLWGFAPAIRRLGHDAGFVPFVTAFCIVMYGLSLLLSGPNIIPMGGALDFLVPSQPVLAVLGSSGYVPVLGYGRWWTIFSASWLHGASRTVGASASIFGLLGALVHYGRKSGSSLIHAEAKRYAVILFVMGLIMPGVDNYAHAGGFLGGYAISAFFNPLTRERGDHLIGAFVCLGATLLAIVVSILTGLKYLR